MKAIKRVDLYVKYDNKQFNFTVESPKEVNMSELLFDLLKNYDEARK